jgi:Spy/CpxP family protein refolding chaperone
MKKTLLLAAIALLVIINITALTTIAYNRWFKSEEARFPHPSGYDRNHAMAFLHHELSLTDEQIEQLREQRTEMEENSRDFKIQLHESRKALMALMKAENPDEAQIDGLIEEIGRIQIALEKQVIHHMLRERTIFTPEQREKFLLMLERHFHERGMRGGPGPHGRRGPHGKHHRPWNPETSERRQDTEASNEG